MNRTYYELTKQDVGRPHIKAFGGVWPVSGFIGSVLPQDVGKRVYLTGGILQVENDRQRAQRLMLETRNEAAPVMPAMSLYDYFAGQALTCVMGSSEVNKAAFAKWAYDFADAMMAEKAKREGGAQ